MTQQTSNTDEPDNMLPPVQVTGGDDGQAGADDQTIPQARALVPMPEEAADSDLIEKEWVLKAKQIVEHTSGDPFTMQEELSKVKADYMRKRYKKDLEAK